MKTLPTLTAQQAQAIANLFLSDTLPDRFTADQPTLADTHWHVPVILAYPVIGSLGAVGEIVIDAVSANIITHTSLEEMKAIGLDLYTARQNEIQAAIS
jgi:hypothetical protein